jgi:hypothetical protein
VQEGARRPGDFVMLSVGLPHLGRNVSCEHGKPHDPHRTCAWSTVARNQNASHSPAMITTSCSENQAGLGERLQASPLLPGAFPHHSLPEPQQHVASVNLQERAFLPHYNLAHSSHRNFWISALEWSRSTLNSQRRYKALGWSLSAPGDARPAWGV